MSKKVKKERYTKDELLIRVKEIFTSNPLSRIKSRDIYILLDVNQRRDKYLISEAISSLLDEEVIREVKNGVFSLNQDNINSVDAQIVQISRNSLYAKVGEYDEDIYIDYISSKNALVGDKVKLIISAARNSKGRIEGVVSEIIERSDRRYSGSITLSRHFGFVDVDSSKMPYDILIPQDGLNGAKDGEKVLVEIVEWPEGGKNPVGMVVNVFGQAGNNDAEMHAILAQYDLPAHFETAVEKCAAQINDKITKSEITKRRDMRSVATCTIDPFDAKDFDDALSLQFLTNGNYEIGVHIADVSHYVKEGSVLDKEAYARATSVYLVDRVVPMLPEVLSNGLCSLRPNEDKLCFSVVFEISDDGSIVDRWYGRTVIHSNRRFTYQEAQDIIEGTEGDLKEEVLTLDRLAKVLRKARFKNGAMAFDRDEAKFNLDENGKPIGVYFKEMKDSNHLVEEFMLLANRSVAEFVGKRPGHKKTFVYRIHDKPDGEKFKNFSEFAAKFGYIMRAKSDRAIGRELNKLLIEIKGTKQENLFSTLALRTMSKATYSTSNIGHYGLAFDYYSHFTSPIRRYPDVMVHRLLADYLAGGKGASKDQYQEYCEHSSQREILAAEAERSSIKYKMVEFLSDKIGEEFEGYVSGVSEWGIYVELEETKIEGMVSVRSMKDDFYQFDPENYKMIGMRHRRSITIGDKLIIKVLRADLHKKQLDYELVAMVDYSTGKIRRITDNSHLKSRTKLSKKRR